MKAEGNNVVIMLDRGEPYLVHDAGRGKWYEMLRFGPEGGWVVLGRGGSPEEEDDHPCILSEEFGPDCAKALTRFAEVVAGTREWTVTKRVKQRNGSDCRIAAVANAAGRPYAEVKRRFGRVNRGGLEYH